MQLFFAVIVFKQLQPKKEQIWAWEKPTLIVSRFPFAFSFLFFICFHSSRVGWNKTTFMFEFPALSEWYWLMRVSLYSNTRTFRGSNFHNTALSKQTDENRQEHKKCKYLLITVIPISIPISISIFSIWTLTLSGWGGGVNREGGGLIAQIWPPKGDLLERGLNIIERGA